MSKSKLAAAGYFGSGWLFNWSSISLSCLALRKTISGYSSSGGATKTFDSSLDILPLAFAEGSCTATCPKSKADTASLSLSDGALCILATRSGYGISLLSPFGLLSRLLLLFSPACASLSDKLLSILPLLEFDCLD